MNRLTAHARFELLPTTAGGRASSLTSGYRSLMRFEGTEVDFGFELKFDPEMGPDGVNPGASGTGFVSVWADEALSHLSPGSTFEIREGTKVVGHGTILGAFTRA